MQAHDLDPPWSLLEAPRYWGGAKAWIRGTNGIGLECTHGEPTNDTGGSPTPFTFTCEPPHHRPVVVSLTGCPRWPTSRGWSLNPCQALEHLQDHYVKSCKYSSEKPRQSNQNAIVSVLIAQSLWLTSLFRKKTYSISFVLWRLHYLDLTCWWYKLSFQTLWWPVPWVNSNWMTCREIRLM